MKIQIAGPGCARCQATEKVVREVCKELNLEAAIEHKYDVREYVKLGIRLTPAVVVDGKIILSGKVPGFDELKEALSNLSG
ncbi:MAG: TM0996/MTH895 family glutaredoxin-like protein [Nitrospinae bacterium]|nr:TM0996/MTH895 family glutaredoxin-like protein [Nitrospinota bacterium]